MSVNVCVHHKETQKTLNDHEERLRELEQSNLKILGRLDALCEKVAELVESIRGLGQTLKKGSYVAITIGIGFIVWYVQSLPR